MCRTSRNTDRPAGSPGRRRIRSIGRRDDPAPRASIERSRRYNPRVKASFLILATCDILLMGVTATVGFLVSGAEGFDRHFLLGLLTAFYTCLVHIVTFMYFAVSVRILEQAVRTGQVGPAVLERATALKSRSLRAAAAGIAAILLVVGFGGAVGTLVSPTVHMLAAFAAIPINAQVFLYQFGLIVKSRRMFDETFGPVEPV